MEGLTYEARSGDVGTCLILTNQMGNCKEFTKALEMNASSENKSLHSLLLGVGTEHPDLQHGYLLRHIISTPTPSSCTEVDRPYQVLLKGYMNSF